MQLIVTKFGSEDLAALELPNDADLDMLMQMVQAELGVAQSEQQLELDDVVLQQGSLAAQGVVDGSSILLKPISTAALASASGASASTASVAGAGAVASGGSGGNGGNGGN
jgi:hypothetical protein